MMLVDVPGRQKANSRLRNVVCNRKLAWFAYYFYRERTMVSQRPDHPLTNRRKTGGKSELFSKSFWKILGAARFVRPILIYGQNGSDRKNMAIMQDCPGPHWKIAKMQDRTRTRWCAIWFAAKCHGPDRRFFVLILERAGGQNVQHLIVNVTAKLSFTFLTSEYHRSP